MKRLILHIDFDSFFASVEQQDNPQLRNTPIGVTATNGRTCIIAASREAKRFGIKSPSRTHDAKKICPSIVFVPAHFVRYWEVSQKFIKICKEYSPTVEIFSIDEVFMDVTLTARLFGGVDVLIKKLKQRLRSEVGEYITASVGISHNKLLAKLASGINKPDGFMAIGEDDVIRVYNQVKLTDFCGIGYRIAKRLQQMGVTTPLKLRLTPLSSLIAEFGPVAGTLLKNIGLGLDESRVVPDTEASEVKSVGRQYCLPHNVYDQKVVLQNIFELCEEIGIKLRRIKKKARTVGIYLGGSPSVHGRQTFERYIDNGRDIFEGCLFAMRSRHCEEGRPASPAGRRSNPNKEIATLSSFARNDAAFVRQISIWTSGLHDAATVPQSLFPYDQKQAKLAQIMDRINAKFGDHTIRNGFLLYADKLTTVPNGFAASVR